MAKAIIGAVIGYAIWTAIWLGGNAVMLPDAAKVIGEGEPYGAVGPLVGAIGLSVICSLAAGFAAAAIAGPRARTALFVTSVLLLLTGIGVQAGIWSLMPLWYHLIFLALIVPVVMLGGRLRKAGSAEH